MILLSVVVTRRVRGHDDRDRAPFLWITGSRFHQVDETAGVARKLQTEVGPGKEG